MVQQTQNICAIWLQTILPNICEMLLTMFINIKTFGLKIITITFLIIFELSFSKHFEIHQHNINKIIHKLFLKNIYQY